MIHCLPCYISRVTCSSLNEARRAVTVYLNIHPQMLLPVVTRADLSPVREQHYNDGEPSESTDRRLTFICSGVFFLPRLSSTSDYEIRCRPAHGFHHVLGMTGNMSEFTRTIKRQRISGNMDTPEGGLDAMLQAAVCQVSIQMLMMEVRHKRHVCATKSKSYQSTSV